MLMHFDITEKQYLYDFFRTVSQRFRLTLSLYARRKPGIAAKQTLKRDPEKPGTDSGDGEALLAVDTRIILD
jgi:hypothetical protein